MITGEQLNQVIQLNLLLLSHLANKEGKPLDGMSLAKLRVAEHSVNFLMDSAVNIILDDMHDHDLTPLGGKEGNTKMRVERDEIAAKISEKIKALPNGEEIYKTYCENLKSFL